MLERVADALMIARLVITDHDTKSASNEYPSLDRLATIKHPRAPHACPAIAKIRVKLGMRQPRHNLQIVNMPCKVERCRSGANLT